MKLIGDKVIVREINEEDIPLLWNFIYGTPNPEWKLWDAPYFPLGYLKLEKYKENLQNMLKANEVPKVAIIERNGEIVGTVSFYWEHEPSRWLEVGVTIFQSNNWSGGIGTNALKLWIDYLFANLEIARVGLTTWSGNERMIKCAEKLGMMMEGRMRKCRYYNGEYYDSIRMGVLREEWNAWKKERESYC
ncbi:GNAT family N-acetyltransferase [Lottiidibacillus patelloidae]|uniref:GNAT family N-acetyltransferase n=2 Tax=Lottiidibacillus patelloidae TaxID=2670334 RepID=A0A263BXY4_9BACI|nr:GNAT family protein [Lottiidibacillus patelloidae]OZM58574.1 GNAT family N-acetyltransferase [Lottiidibacillus patelloidae]